MGGGASVPMPASMSLEFLKEFSGDKFDQVKYNALHDSKGNVSRNMLMSTLVDGVAQEVYTTYLSYCPSGYMSLEKYSKMLRTAKFFSKKANRPSSELIFHASRLEMGGEESAVNYYAFVNNILPKLAEQRETTAHQLFEKLAFIELDNGVESDIIDSKPADLAAALALATAAVASSSQKMTLPPPEVTLKQEKAATLVQNKAREKNAKRKVEQMREIKTIRGEKKPVQTQSRYPKVEVPTDMSPLSAIPRLRKQHTISNMRDMDNLDTLGSEIILEEVFEEYCLVVGEMDASSCKKMFRENNLLSKKFTAVDVDIIFRKSIAKILSSPDDNPLREGVVFEKRVTYPVFRSEIVGQAAHKRNMTLDDFLELLKKNYIETRRVRTSEADHGLAPGSF